MSEWKGAEHLRPLLARVDGLREHPNNPRQGDVEAIRASLRRFGQQRPILATEDGMIVAGHHVVQAAAEEGWEQVAVVVSDLEGSEIDAFLLADNRTGDLGWYDEEALAARLQEIDDLHGTGYSDDDLAALLESLDGDAGLTRAPTGAPPEEQPYATGEATEFTIQLSYDRDGHERMQAALERHRQGFETPAEIILRRCRERP